MALTIFTVYKHPRDYPDDAFVVRRWQTLPNGNVRCDLQPTYVGNDLLEARGTIPPGMANIGRMPADQSVIVESWI